MIRSRERKNSKSENISLKEIIIDQNMHEIIEEYEKKENDLDDTETINEKDFHSEIKLNENFNYDFKKSIKPICMFKDLMGLKSENREKNNKIKQLEQINNKLKRQYNQCLKNNKKMEEFLKQIEFTFKNDQSNQKANEILTRAKKTLHREEQESKNNFKKISKNPKTNQVREFKFYFQVLQEEETKLEKYLRKELEENKKKREEQDYNIQTLKKFSQSLQYIEKMVDSQNTEKQKIRKNHKKELINTGIDLKKKKIITINQNVQRLNREISNELLQKEGHEYEMQILTKKQKGKNKLNEKDESTLKIQIKIMKKKVIHLEKELKEKKKTNQYISKWTKQLRAKLQERKKHHAVTKEQYEHEINQLSREYEEWNRKYKAELVEEQIISKKGGTNDRLMEKNIPEQTRKIRIVKIEEIDHLKKKIVFNLLSLGQKPQKYISEKILKNRYEISMKDLVESFSQIPFLQFEPETEIMKLARYIVQDNNNDFTRVDLHTTVQTSYAFLIFKHLFTTNLTLPLINELKVEFKDFLNRYFDDVRQDLYKQCGKGTTFIPDNLLIVFKKRIHESKKVLELSELMEFLIWEKFNEVCTLSIKKFQKVCESIVGKKLVKDSKIRISKTTIKSFFQLQEKLLRETKKMSKFAEEQKPQE